jgi:1-carboxybiuret hydrolase
VIGSAATIARQVRSGARSAGAVLEETRATITAGDAKLNCFTATTFDRAAREAAAIDAKLARGQVLPPLAGVPYAVKNLFDIEGMVTLAGGHLNASNAPAGQDALLVARMRDAGAVLVGALNMDEHAYGFTTENSHYGATRNPHDTERVAGGSSGGSAAAVGAGLVPITLGSDTNGSIRVPASFCGVFGLKPTYGRLSRRGVFPFVHSLDHVGPLASTVSDLSAAYDVLQGPDAEDSACAQRRLESIGDDLKLPVNLRVGVLGGWFKEWADPAALEAVALAAGILGPCSAAELKGAEAARAAAFIITAAEGGALHRPRLITQFEEFEPLSRTRLVAGSLIPASWVAQAQRVRHEVYREALQLFSRFDLLLAPAAPVVAPRIGTETLIINGHSVPARASLGVLTQPISFIGLPVCCAPVWPTRADGLPMGVQLIGAPWREDICLAAAWTLERQGVAAFRLP